jgi:squalene-hopene/tetraprenyl-beta-curcumene cyclase
MFCSLAGVALLLVTVGEAPPDGASATPWAILPDEPRAESLSLTRSGEVLDKVTLAWIEKKQCASCHTGFPYLMARRAIGDGRAPALVQVRKFLEDRVVAWDQNGKGTGYLQGGGPVAKTEGITEVLAIAATLAIDDAQSTGKLQPITRQALERMWELQQPDGSWTWNKTGLAPSEYDDYYGAVYAALGVGQAPEGYAASASAKEGVARLTAYLQAQVAPNLHHKTWLLWASLTFKGLMTPIVREETIQELHALQRADGGWSSPSLWNWKTRDPAGHDEPSVSDGYATGLVIYVLRQAGVSNQQDAVRHGVDWLKNNQRASGRWFTASLNGRTKHVISNVGTALSVIALKTCEPAAR